MSAPAGCTVAYFVAQSFRGAVHKEYTELFPINYENCPTVIEEKYYLSELPEGYEILDSSSTPFLEDTIYENPQTGHAITFCQWVKSEFDSIHFNTENNEFVEVEINGHYGLYLETLNDGQQFSGIIWDNGDHILEIAGNLAKNDIMKLTKSAKVQKNK